MSGTYEHFVHTKYDAGALAGAYQDAGYLIEIKDSSTAGSKIVMVYADLDKHLDWNTDAPIIERIAQEHFAEYGGGGACVDEYNKRERKT